MICYMPFTDVEEKTLEMLTGALGPITLICPAETLVPQPLRAWMQKALLKVRCPGGIDQSQLFSAIQNYKAWADLHRDNLGDIAGFFKTQKGRFPMTEDTDPTQIGHQIRHYGEPSGDGSVDPIFKAALFLSMAQEYDTCHREMDRSMETVLAMEQQMIKQLSGDQPETATGLSTGGVFDPRSGSQTLDPFMISQRVEAWARLALSEARGASLFVTPNKAAVDHVLDLFPEAVEILNWGLVSTQNEIMQSASRVQETISALARGPADPRNGDFDPGTRFSSEPCKIRLTVYFLPEIPPRLFLRRLAGQGLDCDAGQKQGDTAPLHTQIGWISAQ